MYEVPYTIWVSFMYKASYIYMGPSYVLLHPFYIRWSLYKYSVIHTIMGPSYVHQLLWGLTLVHKMVPMYIQCHTYYYGSILCTLIIMGSYSCTEVSCSHSLTGRVMRHNMDVTGS